MRVLNALFIAVLLSPHLLLPQTQTKKPLSHDVYDRWNRIAGEGISNDGSWVTYTLAPPEKDSRLILYRMQDGKSDTILRGTAPQMTQDSRFVVFLIKPPADSVKKAKIAMKTADEMPKDTVGIVRLGTPGMTVIPRARTFSLPSKGSGWVAIHLEKEITAKDTSKKKDALDAEPGEKGGTAEKGTVLVLRELETGREIRIPHTSEFLFSKNGARLLAATTGNDSTVAPAVLAFDTGRGVVDTLVSGKGKYTGLAWNEDGTRAAFVADRDTSKKKQRFFSVLVWEVGQKKAEAVVDTSTNGFRKGWMVNEFAKPWYSKDSRRLFFGTAPIPLPEDTTFNDVETAKLDVWNWKDGYLQSQQLKGLDAEKKRTYLAVLHLADRKFIQLGDTSMQRVTPGDEGNAGVALGFNDLPYRKLISWEERASADVFLIDIQTGDRTLILRKMQGPASLSPGANYAAWYDLKDRQWYAMGVRSLAKVNLTSGLRVPLYNELNDVPDDPSPHGSMGWMENDSLFFVYDRFDIWGVDPSGIHAPYCLTARAGRKDSLRFRAVVFDPEQRFFRNDSTIILSTFNTRDKRSGFYSIRLSAGSVPESLVMAPCRFGTPIKAKDSPDLILQQMNFSSQELFSSTTAFRELHRISDANPGQKDYLWGTVELFRWKAGDGKPIDGLLYKPENFDPRTKYPMLVYYYERYSDDLYQYLPPAPSASTINRTYCVSNGYIVFVPDIRYRIGHPGRSAMDCIIPGVKALISKGFVDGKRIGIQGQSWGGYQTAFLVTQTSMFRCAFAGAPVSNMTSAYGGIRLESGLVREMQYEKSQSRIGGTLWEKQDLYLENSPLFHAVRVTTPLLIMHNDNDGAVPWQQGVELFTALRRLGKPTWMLVYNNEEHNLVQTKNRKDLSVRMMQFFDHYLKDAPMPVWMSRGIPAINKGKTLGLELEPPTGSATTEEKRR